MHIHRNGTIEYIVPSCRCFTVRCITVAYISAESFQRYINQRRTNRKLEMPYSIYETSSYIVPASLSETSGLVGRHTSTISILYIYYKLP